MTVADSTEEFTFSDDAHVRQDISSLRKSLVNFGILNEEDLHVADTSEQQKASGSDEKEVVGEEDHDQTALLLKQRLQDSEHEGFQQGRNEAICLVLNEIDQIQSKTVAKGMKEWNFTFGLLNSFFIVYVFGAYPEHFWIVYCLESTYWISLKFVQMLKAKPMCEIFYYFDFCWMMNFLGLFLFTGFVFFGHLPIFANDVELRRQLFMAFCGIASGPVFLAAMALPFVAFLFHDVNTMANLIIHILPNMLFYELRYHPEKVQQVYPRIFNLKYAEHMSLIPFFDNGEVHGSVSRNATRVYLGWFIPYTIWMLSIGLKLPSKKHTDSVAAQSTSASTTAIPVVVYDTVFHSLWRDGPCELIGTLIWKRPVEVSRKQSETNTFELRDFLFYMTGHCLSCIFIGIHVVARLCHSSQLMHGIMICISILICASRGARRYTYYATAMYGQQLRKHFGLTKQHKEKSKELKKEQ